jgi:hypothetical protein
VSGCPAARPVSFCSPFFYSFNILQLPSLGGIILALFRLDEVGVPLAVGVLRLPEERQTPISKKISS